MDDREQHQRSEDEDAAQAEADRVEDLNVDEAEAASVKGGRMGDPCDGGEIQSRSTRW